MSGHDALATTAAGGLELVPAAEGWGTGLKPAPPVYLWTMSL